jgi:uncharacterized membrane protein (UPF0127 family)
MFRKPPAEIRGTGHRSRGWALCLVLACIACTGCASAEGGDPADSGTTEAATAAVQEPQERRPPPGRAWVIFGADTVVAEIARTPDERATGLMYREELPGGTGMLFLFDDSQIRSFWMQNTYVPLDIAYLDASLSVVSIHAMEPLTTDGYESAAPAMFALEVPQGWFAANGIGVGSTATVVMGG